jgi:hypothetical protein
MAGGGERALYPYPLGVLQGGMSPTEPVPYFVDVKECMCPKGCLL